MGFFSFISLKIISLWIYLDGKIDYFLLVTFPLFQLTGINCDVYVKSHAWSVYLSKLPELGQRDAQTSQSYSGKKKHLRPKITPTD